MNTHSARPNDVIYDPIFAVSGNKDLFKASIAAKISMATFVKCPIFENMFSDLPHHPRQQLVMRETSNFKHMLSITDFQETSHKPVDVNGSDRFKFFASPIANIMEEVVPLLDIPSTKVTTIAAIQAKKTNKRIQTQFRESSVQTSPWQPPRIVMQKGDLEILKLDFLKWGSGLPAGMHEVSLIERARMKRTWEQSLPPVTEPASLQKRRGLIEAMQQSEWVFREQEIQDIQDLRLELLEKMLIELHEKSKCRTEEKLRNYCNIKLEEKEHKLKKLHHHAQREMRKLENKQHGINVRYKAMAAIEEHVDKKSELYAPLIRHGEHPKRWHAVIDQSVEKYRAHFLGICTNESVPHID